MTTARPVSVVRRPLFGRASNSAIRGEEEAVAAGLQRQSTLLSPLRRALVLQRSTSGNTLLASSPPPRGGSTLSSGQAEAAAAADGDEDYHQQQQQGHHHPCPDMPIKLGVRQRWVERAYLFSYIFDFVVGPVYDRVLLPRPGASLLTACVGRRQALASALMTTYPPCPALPLPCIAVSHTLPNPIPPKPQTPTHTAGQPGKRPVLLVPGWCGRTRSFRKMADRLEREGFPVYPVPLGSQLGCIDRKATQISQYLDDHGLEDGASVWSVVCVVWLLVCKCFV